MSLDKVIIALDFSKKNEALRVVDELEGLIDFYKVGLELFLSEGVDFIKILKKKNKKIFLDLKFHDIPNTIQRAVKVCLGYGVEMLTLHSSGGFDMLKRAVEIVEETKIKDKVSLKLLGVTVLTSLDDNVLREIYGTPIKASNLVKNLALLSKKAGLDGIVASASEIRKIKELCGEDFLVVTPGIRLYALPNDDQRRTITPQEAFLSGADYIVVGRAVTSSSSSKEALLKLLTKEQVYD